MLIHDVHDAYDVCHDHGVFHVHDVSHDDDGVYLKYIQKVDNFFEENVLIRVYIHFWCTVNIKK